MAHALGKGFVVTAAAAVAALVFAFEGFAFALWALDNKTGCRAGDECDLNALGAALAGAVVGFEALVGTAIAGLLLAFGRVKGAKIAAGSLLGLLALEHVWLLV